MYSCIPRNSSKVVRDFTWIVNKGTRNTKLFRREQSSNNFTIGRRVGCSHICDSNGLPLVPCCPERKAQSTLSPHPDQHAWTLHGEAHLQLHVSEVLKLIYNYREVLGWSIDIIVCLFSSLFSTYLSELHVTAFTTARIFCYMWFRQMGNKLENKNKYRYNHPRFFR